MNNKSILIIIGVVLLTVLLVTPAYAQYREYYIFGKVVDTAKQPLAKVKIQLQDIKTSRKYGTKTKKDGSFKLAGLPHGIYQVTMTKEGYETRTDEWRFETPQDRMQKVEVKTTIMVSKEKLAEMKRSKKLEEMFKKATESIRNKDFDGAITVLKTMLAEKADDINAMYMLGICYLNKSQPKEAVETLKKVVRMKSDFSGAHLQLGVAFQKLEDYDNALASFKNVLKTDQKNMIALFNSGIILYSKKKAAEAIEYFQKALALTPDSAELEEMIGLCYLQTEKYDLALEYLGKAKSHAKDPEKIKSLGTLVDDLKKQLGK